MPEAIAFVYFISNHIEKAKKELLVESVVLLVKCV